MTMPKLHSFRLMTASVTGASLLALAMAGAAFAADNSPIEIGLWGDLPYSDVQAAAIPALIADMNSQKLKFTVFDGDMKAGSNSACDNNLYNQFFAWFGMFTAPAA